MLRLLTCFITLLSLSGCTSRGKNEYVKWVENYDNGLHVSRTMNEYRFDVQYQPVEYLTNLKEVSSDQTSIQHYLLAIEVEGTDQSIEKYNSKDEVEMQEKLYYLSYRFQHDISLEEEGAILSCVLFHFERSADLKTTRTFVLGFENPYPNSTSATLVINSQLFGSLPLKIKVSKENPVLKYL